MNYDITQLLLDAISLYCDLSCITVSTENKDWKGRHYLSDVVTLVEKNNVRFEVFDKEIIVSYFTDHVHFEDYSFELKDGEPNFVIRVKEFLVQLFSLPVRHMEVYKGTKLIYEKYFFVKTNNEEECISGIISHRRLFGFNPFAKKHYKIQTWYYERKEGFFIIKSN